MASEHHPVHQLRCEISAFCTVDNYTTYGFAMTSHLFKKTSKTFPLVILEHVYALNINRKILFLSLFIFYCRTIHKRHESLFIGGDKSFSIRN